MSDRSKLYLVSMLGITRKIDEETGKPVSSYVHIPLLMDAQSIEIVEEEACIQANRLFSMELGFQTKHIAIQPVAQAEYLRLLELAHHGLLANSDEPPEQAVEFICTLADPDPDESLIIEFNKFAS